MKHYSFWYFPGKSVAFSRSTPFWRHRHCGGSRWRTGKPKRTCNASWRTSMNKSHTLNNKMGNLLVSNRLIKITGRELIFDRVLEAVPNPPLILWCFSSCFHVKCMKSRNCKLSLLCLMNTSSQVTRLCRDGARHNYAFFPGYPTRPEPQSISCSSFSSIFRVIPERKWLSLRVTYSIKSQPVTQGAPHAHITTKFMQRTSRESISPSVPTNS